METAADAAAMASPLFVLLIHMRRDIIACIGTSVTKLIHIHAPHALRACINYSYMQLT